MPRRDAAIRPCSQAIAPAPPDVVAPDRVYVDGGLHEASGR